MTSKTFKSSRPTGTMLRVDSTEVFSEAHLTIVLHSREEDICIDPSDVAELMLAIGDTLPVPDMVLEGSYEHFLGNAIHYLTQAVKAQERATAEAEAQAELEAEALELRNEYFGKECAWSDINNVGQALWLRMARKARELAKEATK